MQMRIVAVRRRRADSMLARARAILTTVKICLQGLFIDVSFYFGIAQNILAGGIKVCASLDVIEL